MTLTIQCDLDRVCRQIIAPALSNLSAGWQIDGPTPAFLGEVRLAMGHEVRRACALMLGGMFERQLRGWLAQVLPGDIDVIQRGARDKIWPLIGLAGRLDIDAMDKIKDVVELWELVSALRHGNGRAASWLAQNASSLWSDLGPDTRSVETLNITDADLERYYTAAMVFWGQLGATPATFIPRLADGFAWLASVREARDQVLGEEGAFGPWCD